MEMRELQAMWKDDEIKGIRAQAIETKNTCLFKIYNLKMKVWLKCYSGAYTAEESHSIACLLREERHHVFSVTSPALPQDFKKQTLKVVSTLQSFIKYVSDYISLEKLDPVLFLSLLDDYKTISFSEDSISTLKTAFMDDPTYGLVEVENYRLAEVIS